MKITEKWLEKESACSGGVEWFKNQKETKDKKVLEALIKDKKLDWANWLVVRCLDKKKKILYAIFAAEEVIDLYEKKYPKDDRPRKAIEAAKAYLKKPNEVNKNAANAAANAANAAANAAAYAAANAAYAAANAAYAAYAAAYAAYAAANATYAANAAAYAANAAYAMKEKIIRYGMSLL